MAIASGSITALRTIPMEEYLRTSYHPDCDFVDGVLEERSMGELEHSIMQIALGAWFFAHRAEWKIRVASEYRTKVSASRIRLPDISVFAHDGLNEQVRVTPPLLCIEILSPDDRIPRVVRRLQDFLAMGVPNLWLIDPIERAAFTYTEGGLRLVEEDRLAISGSPIYLDLAELFSALD